jgi:hypothetical protein
MKMARYIGLAAGPVAARFEGSAIAEHDAPGGITAK